MLIGHFKQFLALAVKSCRFELNDIYYKNIDGSAMGSPLGHTFANVFLVYHEQRVYYEQKWLESCSL